ncbi:hypothetical protein ACLI4Z_17805 [Natrialbaceae archaeon A-arb3/5]
MLPDYHPIPQKALPPGWEPDELRSERFVYRHTAFAVALIADATTADRTHPGLGISRCWKVCYRHSLGDQPVTKLLGHVPTRQSAVDGLLECMRRVHETDGCDDDPAIIPQIFESVSLPQKIPEKPPGPVSNQW